MQYLQLDSYQNTSYIILKKKEEKISEYSIGNIISKKKKKRKKPKSTKTNRKRVWLYQSFDCENVVKREKGENSIFKPHKKPLET